MEQKIWLHVTIGGIDLNFGKSFAALKTCEDVRNYFANCVGELPYRFPENFQEVHAFYVNSDQTKYEAWVWGARHPLITEDSWRDFEQDVDKHGYLVEVDGELVYDGRKLVA